MNGYHIYDEFLKLGLTGKALDVYAIIAQYSQYGQGCYYGGYDALAKRLGCGTRQIRRIVAELLEKKLIEREYIVRNDGKYAALCTVSLWDVNVLKGEDANVPKGEDINVPKSRRDTSLYRENKNINNTLSNERVSAKTRKTAPQRKAATTFERPSQEEVAEYVRSRGNRIDAEAFFAFYESNGWKVGRAPMRDWHAAVVTWEKRERQRKLDRETPFERSLRAVDEMYGTNLMGDNPGGKNGIF